MRFPFGRGARQREIDSLRQRIAELQDDITKIEGSLAADSPDVETTDAYRSVQLLRESMRRDELAALREELRGVEARLQTLTGASSAEQQSAAEGEPDVSASSEAEPAGVEAAGEAEVDGGGTRAAEAADLGERGLPSERAIIEPPLPSRAVVPDEERPRSEAAEGVPSEEESQPVAGQTTGPGSEGLAAAAEEALERVVQDEGPSVVEEEPVAATTAADEGPQTPPEPEPEPAAEAEVVGAPTAETETTAQPVAASAAEDRAEPIPAAIGTGSGIYVTDEVEPEPTEGAAQETPRRRSRAWVLIVALVVAVVAVVLVAAFESGLIAPTPPIVPTSVPTAQPTLRPPVVVPPTPLPTAGPTAPPSPAP